MESINPGVHLNSLETVSLFFQEKIPMSWKLVSNEVKPNQNVSFESEIV